MKKLFLSKAPIAIAALLLTSTAAVAIPNSSSNYQNGWGFDVSGMNNSVQPGDNFFDYANGRYIDHLRIPADLPSYGPFAILHEKSLQQQKDILEDLRQKSKGKQITSLSDYQKLAVFYADFMDTQAINALGITPLNEELKTIRSLETKSDIARYMGSNVYGFRYSPIAIDIEQNQKDPNHYMLILDQGMSIGVTGGLGLPDQSYYSNPEFKKIREAYKQYIRETLDFDHWPHSSEMALQILKLETDIAKVQLPRSETRDPIKTFNPMKVKSLNKKASDFDWNAFLNGAGISSKQLKKELINVREPEAIAKMVSIINMADIETIKAWLAFHLIDNSSGYLSDTISKHSFQFNATILAGIKTQSPRWKRGVKATNQTLGWILSKAYTEKYFPDSAKQEIINLTNNIKEAFSVRLAKNTWMDEETRQKALYKLSKFTIKVGYPNKWRDYTNLEIKPGDLFGNANRAAAFEWNYRLNRLDQPVDRDEWEMFPQMVNAYNNPTMNEVVFPAAILQPPFFDPKGDKAVNFGGIGGVIGHELSHGFDDQGRHYSAEGKLSDWWSEQSAQKFSILANQLADQYSRVEIAPGLHVNGQMTLGEDIADLGGLNLALEAYNIYATKKHLIDGDRKHGFTGMQRVFLGWAQVWRQKDRPDTLKKLVLSNEHAPATTRVNLPVRNIDSWYKSFNVKKENKLYLEPNNRVNLW